MSFDLDIPVLSDGSGSDWDLFDGDAASTDGFDFFETVGDYVSSPDFWKGATSAGLQYMMQRQQAKDEKKAAERRYQQSLAQAPTNGIGTYSSHNQSLTNGLLAGARKV
ncbi:hypothetical protein [Neptunomonas marina]|uniref:Uncharacterized protein n=1 Tax=Neptunomonas marina TaxID=1815562 RepID=A0A437QEA6_9GAMM|nr:hypothetical protein [Neptunomonas marina]RVU32723.1 hypothetical protein EOE65_03445 [Neptunomonas marina]